MNLPYTHCLALAVETDIREKPEEWSEQGYLIGNKGSWSIRNGCEISLVKSIWPGRCDWSQRDARLKTQGEADYGVCWSFIA